MPDKRISWRMPTREEAMQLGLDDEQYVDLAAAAVVRIEDDKHPLKGKADDVAKASGLTLATARKRAADRGLKHR